jgi:hypothetical protein
MGIYEAVQEWLFFAISVSDSSCYSGTQNTQYVEGLKKYCNTVDGTFYDAIQKYSGPIFPLVFDGTPSI